MENFDQKIKNKISSLEYNQAPDEILMERMFKQLERNQVQDVHVINLSSEKGIRKANSLYLRIAAAIAILVTAGFSLYQFNEVDLYVSKGSKLEHHLPDGSVVQLNADSRLDYNELSWLFSRSVSLEGEAYFEVGKGKKFIVSSGRSNTQVLGTSFNIYARGQDYRVECITGRVKVIYTGGIDEVILSPGTGIHYGGSAEGKRFEFSNEDLVDWRSGEYHFNNEPLRNVIDELSRQYNIEVRMNPKYDQNKYTGYFNDKNLETALKLICDPIELDYQIGDVYIVIE